MRIVLASASPRRRELLEMMGVKFEVIPAVREEMPCGLEPGRTAQITALGKAREVAWRVGNDAAVIAADTIVYVDGKALGKPENEEDAFRMLRMLSGREHRVYTGVAVISGGVEKVGFERTAVRFAEMTDDDIRQYISTGEPMDKAGAYGAQGEEPCLLKELTVTFSM